MKSLKTAIFLLLVAISTASAWADELFKSNVEASYYADKFHGRKTSSGEIFDMNALTAAHKTLPFGTVVKVTNLENNKSVNVRINDRGPFVAGREIDISKAAATKLDMIKTGTARVSLTIVSGSTETSIAKVSAAIQKAKTLDPNKTWDIQLGAFSKRDNADALAQKLLKAGFENVVFQKTETVIRVVIRNVATDNVQRILEDLEAKGFSDYFVRERANVK